MKIKIDTDSFSIIGESPQIREVFDTVTRAAGSQSAVMIYGESGTGKELIARALHLNSPRASQPFITVNCAAIPHDLLESELFGYEKDAFTGAVNTHIGRMELANQGTVFLDEIGDMPLTLQVKLLRVLAERKIDRIGSTKSMPLDIRVITATRQNLETAIEESRFREDLYYQLNIIPLNLPPLRERKMDIPLLVNHFLARFNRSGSPKAISDEAMNVLVNYSWPGNIRELANFVERMVVLGIGSTITPRDLPDKVMGEAPREKWTPLAEEPQPEGNPAQILQRSLKQSFRVGIPDKGVNLKKLAADFEKELLIEALEKTDWVKNKAAILLGLNRTTLVEKLKKLKITNPETRR